MAEPARAEVFIATLGDMEPLCWQLTCLP